VTARRKYVPMPAAEFAAHGRRAGQRARNSALYRVDGETVTLEQIIERTGRGRDYLVMRISHLRRAKRPVTWARLEPPHA
jgi:hypothetical protein